MSRQLNIRIKRTETNIGHKAVLISFHYTVYVLSVETQRGRWETRKRFRDFELFDRQIRERFSFDTPIPSLPSKHRLKNMEPAFVEQRKVALQCYLDSMLDFPYVVQSEIMRCFLKPDEDVVTERHDQQVADFAQSPMAALYRTPTHTMAETPMRTPTLSLGRLPSTSSAASKVRSEHPNDVSRVAEALALVEAILNEDGPNHDEIIMERSEIIKLERLVQDCVEDWSELSRRLAETEASLVTKEQMIEASFS